MCVNFSKEGGVQEPNNDRLAQTGFRHFYELLLVLYHGLCVVYKAGS